MTIPSKVVQKLKITRVVIEFEDERGKHRRVFPRDWKLAGGKAKIKVVYMLAVDAKGGLSRYYGEISTQIVNIMKKDLERWLFDAKIGFHT